MDAHDLELYRGMLKERDEYITKLEEAILFATYKTNNTVRVSFYEMKNLAENHPVLLDVHTKNS